MVAAPLFVDIPTGCGPLRLLLARAAGRPPVREHHRMARLKLNLSYRWWNASSPSLEEQRRRGPGKTSPPVYVMRRNSAVLGCS